MSARPRQVLAAAAILGALAAVLASRLELRTAFTELLPHDDPGVVTLKRTQERVGDFTLMLVGIRSPDGAANLRYADALTAHLRSLPSDVCEQAAYDVRDVRAFFVRNTWLYLSEADLEEVRDRVRLEIGRRKNPLLVPLSDDDETLEQMGERLRGRSTGQFLGGRFQDGTFSEAGGELTWVAALPPGGLFAERAGDRLLEEVEAYVARNPPSAFHPAMRVLPAGPLVTAVRNRQAIENDVIGVTVICVSIVAASIALFFGRGRRRRGVAAVPLVVLPAVLGTLIAFAAAEVAFGVLNSSTAFLGSIILGNGINYAIILAARVEERRGAGEAIEPAIRAAIAGVWRGTLASAVAAAAAYASLTVTSFRGFSQFGLMGAIGALACWAATFTVLPALLRLTGRSAAARSGRPQPSSMSDRRAFARVARLVSRHPAAVLAAGGALTVGALYGARHFLHDPFEYDFRRLSAKLADAPERAAFTERQEALFGRWPHPTLVLSDRLDQVEPLRAAIHRQDTVRPAQKMIGQIVTIYDVLPGPPAVQARKLALIEEIRRLASDRGLEALTDAERARLESAIPPAGLRVLEPSDLPSLARRPFTEVDGTVGRVLLVYHPDKTVTQWNGHDMLDIAGVLREIRLPAAGARGEEVIETSGASVVFGAMLRSVLRDGPIASAVSLAAVILVTVIAWRGRFGVALPAIGALLVGVLWMVGLAGLGGVRITFLNFIALPITFGIGVEYAVNVLARVREESTVAAAVASTGGAVALCSWTTIVGYGSLLASRTQALRGFGAMAILGEVACLVAAVAVMPAALIVLRRQR